MEFDFMEIYIFSIGNSLNTRLKFHWAISNISRNAKFNSVSVLFEYVSV